MRYTHKVNIYGVPRSDCGVDLHFFPVIWPSVKVLVRVVPCQSCPSNSRVAVKECNLRQECGAPWVLTHEWMTPVAVPLLSQDDLCPLTWSINLHVDWGSLPSLSFQSHSPSSFQMLSRSIWTKFTHEDCNKVLICHFILTLSQATHSGYSSQYYGHLMVIHNSGN